MFRLRCLLLGFLTTALAAAQVAPPNPAATAKLAAQPLAFEPNQGQTDPKVRYLARAAGATLFLTGPEAVLSLRGGAVLRMRLEGGGAGKAEALEPLPGMTHYYTGNDPARWHANVPHSARVRFAGVYPGIDAVWYGRQGSPEVDYVVAPGADPSVIDMSFQGADRLEIAASGDLVVHLGSGRLTLRRPVAYQEIDGVRREVASRYRLQGGRVGFELAHYDATRPLVIDPVLSLSSFLGGDDLDDVRGVAAFGNDVYAVGRTESPDFPGATAAAVDNAVFVSRIDLDGRGVVFTTLLDGRRSDIGQAIAVDAQGAAYVTGRTDSLDFPIFHAFDSQLNSSLTLLLNNDAFVTKLNSTGGLAFSTYLGGRFDDVGQAIALDGNGRPYVAGSTGSFDFPLKNEIQGGGLFESSHAFLTVFAADGQSIAYSTMLGGKEFDFAEALAVDRRGNAYLGGSTESRDFPVNLPFQSSLQGTRDGWVAKIDPASSRAASLVYSTYLGGEALDEIHGIAVDAAGQAHVTGFTTSRSFPLAAPAGLQPFDRLAVGEEAFVAKLDAAGNELLFSSYLGGIFSDVGEAITVDSAGAVYVAGGTESPDFPSVNAFQPALAGEDFDAFVAKIDPLSATLLWSTYLGGKDFDAGEAIALDSQGNVYVGGETFSGGTFPQIAAFQDSFGGGLDDGFLARIESTAADTVGVFRETAGKFFLRNSNTSGVTDLTVNLGQVGDLPVTGEWLGAFGDRPGVFRAGTFILKPFFNDLVCCNIIFAFGQAGDLPVAGDWDGDGIDSVGVFRPATGEWLLRNSLSAGAPDVPVFAFGAPGDLPVAGDWDGDGVDTIGVFRPATGQWFLRNSNTAGNPDLPIFVFGIASDQPVTGDWDGDGVTTIGVLRGNEFLLSNDGGTIDLDFVFETGGGLPLAGDWNGRP